MGPETSDDGGVRVGSTVLSVVLGCFNGAKHLEASLLRLAGVLDALGVRYEIIVVDDGSGDASFPLLMALRRRIPALRVLRNTVNRGKGHAIAKGVSSASGRYIIFTDIDLAYDEQNLVTVLRKLEGGAPLVVGNRRLPESVYTANNRLVRYVYRRHLIGRAFNLVVRLLFGVTTRDTQSGLKGFHAPAARRIFARVFTNRFLFDIEIFIRARVLGIPVCEIPVHVTYRDDDSTVRQAVEFLRLLPELLAIKAAQLTGRYLGEAERYVGQFQRLPHANATGQAVLMGTGRVLRRP